MIDIHAHVLFNTDDGSESLEESVNMIREAGFAGFDTICCTSHYFEPYYTNNKMTNNEVLEQIKKRLKEENIDTKLILANEVYVTGNMIELLEEDIISRIGNSNYILIEFPMSHELKYVKNIITELQENGLQVIVAHPERYSYVQKDISYMKDFLDMGVYFQSNYASILGKYGKEAEKTVKKLLEGKMIHMLATDCHREDSIYTYMDTILEKLKNEIKDEDYFKILTEENPANIINNRELIEVDYVIKKKFKLF